MLNNIVETIMNNIVRWTTLFSFIIALKHSAKFSAYSDLKCENNFDTIKLHLISQTVLFLHESSDTVNVSPKKKDVRQLFEKSKERQKLETEKEIELFKN